MKLLKTILLVAVLSTVGVAQAEHSNENENGVGHQGSTGGSSSGNVGNTNTNSNASTGGTSSVNGNFGTGDTTSSVGNTNAYGGSSKASSSNTGNNYTTSNTTNIDNPASTAYAPSVQVGGADMCRSGVGAGGQGSAFGISFGGSVVDENCERLKLSREIAVTLGDRATAKELLCQDPRVAKAYASSGKPCQAKEEEVASSVAPTTMTMLGTR